MIGLLGVDHINSRHGHIGRVKRGNSCKDVGIVYIDTRENRKANKFVKPSQSCHITRCREIGLKTVLYGIPRGSCRVNIIANEAYKIDKQECPGETQAVVALSFEKLPDR